MRLPEGRNNVGQKAERSNTADSKVSHAHRTKIVSTGTKHEIIGFKFK